MDNSFKNILVRNGLLLQEQSNNRLVNKIIQVNKDTYEIIPYKDGFYLKKSSNNSYLFFHNDNLDIVEKTDSDFFNTYGVFIIMSDNICCSIFPKSNLNYILCYSKKEISCQKVLIIKHLLDFTTIFKLNSKKMTIKPKPKSLEKPIRHHFIKSETDVNINNTEWIKLNKLTSGYIDNSKLFITVTTNPKSIPTFFCKNIYHKVNCNVPSLLYLKYIIEHYDNLPNIILFTKEFKKEYYDLEKQIIINSITNVYSKINMRITGDGLRYKYKHNDDTWSSWNNCSNVNIKKEYPIDRFIGKVLKMSPQLYYDYSNDFFYVVPSNLILNHSKLFYNKILSSILNNPLKTSYMDKLWYFILYSSK